MPSRPLCSSLNAHNISSQPVRSEQGSPSPLPRSQRSGPTTSTSSSAAPASARGSTSSARGKVQHHLHAQSLVAGSSDDAPDDGAAAVDEDDDDESSASTVILSLLTRGAQLGAAVYNEATGKLLLLEDSMIKGARLGLQQDLTGRLLTPIVDGEERAAPWDFQQEDAVEDLVTMREFKRGVQLQLRYSSAPTRSPQFSSSSSQTPSS